MDVKNKVVIVTGASQGIGLATARLLQEEGARVVLVARSEMINSLEKELPKSLAIIADLREDEDIKRVIGKTIEEFGRIDILINNAGQGIHGFTVEETPIEEYRKIMELNVFSVMKLMQEVIPLMKKEGGGMIINVSSKVTTMYLPNLAAYSSTKYALNSITQSARQELRKYGVVVSAVLPGLTKTNFMENSVGDESLKGYIDYSEADSPEKVAKVILKTIISEEGEVLV